MTNVANAAHSTRLLAQTTLRNQLGQLTLSGLLSERDSISQTMQGLLDTATDPWGIKVERVEVKDVRLPQQLQRAMAAEAEATELVLTVFYFLIWFLRVLFSVLTLFFYPRGASQNYCCQGRNGRFALFERSC